MSSLGNQVRKTCQGDEKHQLSSAVGQGKEDGDRVQDMRQQCAVPRGLDDRGSGGQRSESPAGVGSGESRTTGLRDRVGDNSFF